MQITTNEDGSIDLDYTVDKNQTIKKTFHIVYHYKLTLIPNEYVRDIGCEPVATSGSIPLNSLLTIINGLLTEALNDKFFKYIFFSKRWENIQT